MDNIENVKEDYVVTGVINNQNIEYLYEEAFDGVDISFEEFLLDNDLDIDNEEDFEQIDDYEGDCSTYFIGYKKLVNGVYDIDPDAEYSAIVGEIYTQVTNSKYISYAAACSPCFPFQNDLSTSGDYATFTLPPDVFGDEKHLKIYKLIN